MWKEWKGGQITKKEDTKGHKNKGRQSRTNLSKGGRRVTLPSMLSINKSEYAYYRMINFKKRFFSTTSATGRNLLLFLINNKDGLKEEGRHTINKNKTHLSCDKENNLKKFLFTYK